MSQEKLEILRRGQAAFSRGDEAAMTSTVTGDAEWESLGTFPGVKQIYRGREGVAEWMEAIRSSFAEFEVVVESLIADVDDLLVVVERLRASGRESGAEVEMRIYSVYRFEGDKLAGRRAFVTKEEALAAAGLSA